MASSSSSSSSTDHILTLSCPDRPGIVHAVTAVFADHGHNILDLQQFSDPVSQRFFMRVHFNVAAAAAAATLESEAAAAATAAAAKGDGGDDDASSSSPATAHLASPFAALAARYAMDHFDVRPAARRTRVLIMVSKIGHCLNDLLFRMRRRRSSRIDVRSHRVQPPGLRAPWPQSYGIDFQHLPVVAGDAATKARPGEAHPRALIERA